MKTKGITLVEGLIAGGLVLVLAVPMVLGVLDTRRRSRDASVVSLVRQTQAALEAYRARTASYPERTDLLRSDDADLADALGYAPEPSGCGSVSATPCQNYRLQFALEGQLGALAGGSCTAERTGLSCSQ
ncbi:MAG: hypothetical protein QY323_01545 [Patescibacteria group bacterium]|nr:MAG: hypothetical protein QY323_01545 [Patescibacteria group bacterium]